MAVLLTLLVGFAVWGLGLLFLPDDPPEWQVVYFVFTTVVGFATVVVAARFVPPFFD